MNSAEKQQKSAENLLIMATKLRIRTGKLRRETQDMAEYLRAKSEKLGNSKGGK